MKPPYTIHFLINKFHIATKFIVAKIKSNRYAIILAILASYIALKSYQPHTILSGWDTLHPEFDFANYFKRILTVWQSYQGLGAPPSQSHLGDLPHAAILWILSLIFPLNSLRYIYILFMLVIGPLGVYFFSKRFVFLHEKPAEKYAFLSGLFYLLNLGTLQIFFTPFEMFVTLYGFLGWFFLSIFDFIKFRTRKNTLKFFLFTILLTPVSHTATLWFVFYIGTLLTLLAASFVQSFTHGFNKKIAGALILLFLLNAFWILPNLYYAKNYSRDIQLSKTHRLGSNEFFFRSQKRGGLKDLMLITNFPFDWNIYDFGRKIFVPQMENWSDYIKTDSVSRWGYITFGLFLIGIGASILKKNKFLVSFLPFLFICIFFLRNANFPFTTLFLFLRERFSFFSEVFRFPFTKFAPFYLFFYSVFFAYGTYIVTSVIAKRFSVRVSFWIFTFLALGQILCMSPALQQGYVSSFMKVAIPNEYFALFSYMKNIPKNRVLILPLHSPFGWVYHDWNYQGAGFLWFGLSNGLLDREFDRWYPYNEQSYNEFVYALYKRDARLFSLLLKKYRIEYILLDESIIDTNPKNSKQITFTRETKELLSKIPSIQINWKSRFITLLRNWNDFHEVEIFSNLTRVSPSYRFTYEDQAYEDLGHYISVQKDAHIEYPFRTFLDEEYRLSRETSEKIRPYLDRSTSVVIEPENLTNGQSEMGTNWKKIISQDYTHYESRDKTIGSSYNLEELPQDQGYLIQFKSRNTTGLPLHICIKNAYSGRCDIQDELSQNKNWIDDSFALPPTNQGIGYKIEISNISTGTLPSINDLSAINVIRFPYSFLKEMKVSTNSQIRLHNQEKTPIESHQFILGTVVSMPRSIPNSSVIFLNQAYEKNWKAYKIDKNDFFHRYFPFIFGEELKEHVLIDNWTNGWALRPSTNAQDYAPQGANIVIIFWPQYLEFLGLGLLALSLIYVSIYRDKIH